MESAAICSAVQLHEASTSAAIGPVSWIRWMKVESVEGCVGFPPGLVGKGENDLQMTIFYMSIFAGFLEMGEMYGGNI